MRDLFGLLSIVLVPLVSMAADPVELPLWEKGPPGFTNRKAEPENRITQKSGEYKLTNIHQPTLTVYLPPKEKAKGVGVVIAPGGGFRELWMMHEGSNLATWLNERGIAAFVLKYRLPREKDSPYKLDVHPLEDGQRAIRFVRHGAKDFGIDPARVGIVGFSAGGELTALTSTAKGDGQADANDPIERFSAKPAFQALIYSGPLGIREAKVHKDIPPTFILVGDNDNAATWLVSHYQALKKVGVSCELHILAKAPHGFGLRPNKTTRAIDTWPQRFEEFLSVQGFLDPKAN